MNDVARLLLPRVHIGQVSCGQKHGIALDSQGGAWSWGASDLGQCGLGTKDDVALPQRIHQLAWRGILVRVAVPRGARAYGPTRMGWIP